MYDNLIKRLQEDKPSRRMMLTAADAIEELIKPRWVPVTERLPDDGEYVLAYSADDDFTTVEARHRFGAFQITHWMPLPEPPEEDN